MHFKLSSDLLELVLQAQKLSVSGHALTQVKSDDLSDKLSLVSFRFVFVGREDGYECPNVCRCLPQHRSLTHVPPTSKITSIQNICRPDLML